MQKHMITIAELVAAVFFFMSVTGCATIIKGDKQTVNLKTIPQGANCDVYNNKTNDRISTVTTPASLTLDRGRGYFRSSQYRIRCTGTDNSAQEAILDGNPNGYYLGGNILLGGLIGYLIVDPLTGAMWTLEPETVLVDFQDPSKSILKQPVAIDNTST
ncbi:MAG: hypothetical protein HY896_00985 [Deltaproteobacteria bacterium]|nr:hypothetical protein [Deltaproteobacteria bacterium]